MYLSRVQIDTNNRKKIRDLTHIGAYHNWVEQSFPEEIRDNKRSRKLWRIDELGGNMYMLVVSETKPDIEKLERYGVEGSASTLDYSDFIDNLKEGQIAQFRIKVNPVISKYVEGAARGRVIPLVSDGDQLKYLEDRSIKNGFELIEDEYMIVSKGYEKFKRKGKRTINIVKAEYEGKLKITDIEKFKELLINGLGKKKAYGFGMMTVIPQE